MLMRFLPRWIARSAEQIRTPRSENPPRVEPAYKQQTAVDAKQGVILDVEVTTGGVHDSNTLSALDEVPRVTGRSITIATMDAGHGVARVFAELEARRIEAIVPTRKRSKANENSIFLHWVLSTGQQAAARLVSGMRGVNVCVEYAPAARATSDRPGCR
jgi:hypothetical protein